MVGQPLAGPLFTDCRFRGGGGSGLVVRHCWALQPGGLGGGGRGVDQHPPLPWPMNKTGTQGVRMRAREWMGDTDACMSQTPPLLPRASGSPNAGVPSSSIYSGSRPLGAGFLPLPRAKSLTPASSLYSSVRSLTAESPLCSGGLRHA